MALSLNAARIDEIYAFLASMEMKLEEDPAAVPPGYIQKNVAVCARFSSHLSNLMMEVGKALAVAERAVELLKAQVEIRYSDALMHNEEINKVRRSATNRAALAKLIVAEDTKELAEWKAKHAEFKYLMDACKRKERELKIADQAIRLQAKVLGLELDLGGKGTGVDASDEPEPPDEPINDALRRGDGTPVVAVAAPPDPESDPVLDSLVSGMSYDVLDVEVEKNEIDDFLEKLG